MARRNACMFVGMAKTWQKIIDVTRRSASAIHHSQAFETAWLQSLAVIMH